MEDVLSHIVVRPSDRSVDGDEDVTRVVNMFKNQLFNYLRGIGHPNDKVLREIIGGDIFDRDANDPLLRVQALLKTTTGARLLPVERTWTIKVCAFIFIVFGHSHPFTSVQC